ncbi:glycosyltransferase [Rhodanobacter sp. OK091]|uniref:glycosyltransferase n=1 Tax=Rhodanobacter sp. OK091 TaxID=1881037 RepID=UPI000922003E|nr:glycosyltransferase [Rhodanobacter sp. OK091]SHM49098.1 hypothetical protein SAMN05428972_3774 [Rhodanobacter sp. OK091]
MTLRRSSGKQALLVIGMHRSGTSALTRVINLHGVTLGSKLPGGAFDNEAGFWENQRVVNLHERLLADIGSSWDDPRELRLGWADEALTAAYIDELIALIASEFGDARIWAVKDPRLCRLLPLWLKALGRMGIEPKLIFAMRDPSEVVGSLMHRNGLSAATASLLWLRHLAEPVRLTQNMRRCLVDYNELLDNWHVSMSRIASDLDVAWPIPSQDCEVEVDVHLRHDLRHQHMAATRDLLPVVWREPLLDVYAASQTVVRDRGDWADLDAQLHVVMMRLEFARPLIMDLQPKSQRDQIQSQLIEAENGKEAYRAEAARLFEESAAAQRHGQQEAVIARQEAANAMQESANARQHAASAMQEAASARQEAASATQEAANARQHAASAMQEAASARQEAASARQEAASARQEAASATQEAANATQEAASARQEVASATRETASARQEAANATRQAASVQEELKNARKETASVREELENARKETVSVREELESARRTEAQAREVLHGELIVIRGELAKRNARIRMLEQVSDELDMIKASRSWRWTRPMRVALRMLRSGGRLGEADREQLRRRLRRSQIQTSALPTHAALPAVPTSVDTVVAMTAVAVPMPMTQSTTRFALQIDGKRDVFVWSVIDWHFRIQRPQHLARELAAASHRVFYISNNFINRDEPGFSVEALDSDGRLFQINLHLKGSPAIYHAAPDMPAREQLRAGIGLLLGWTRSRGCASLVQHPYWLETAQVLPDSRLVYDCMDHHGGFADNSVDVLAREHELMRDADLLVVTSDWLYEESGKYNPHRVMIRNACQYEHFFKPPAQKFKDDKGRRIIGYYGAIAEWFDLDLLEKLAQRFDDCLILLVGADTTGAQQRLRHLSNVEFTGEVSYSTLPHYLHAFDVCLLPFQVIPLTLATNPVKVYEYLSAGKEVVSISLPEIRQFGELVRTGTDHASFLHAVNEALTTAPEPAVIARRQQFAAGQTWAHRVHDLIASVDSLPAPRVSVVVVTYNNLELTKACLHSIELYSDYPDLEVIVVDNASADGTPACLIAWAASGENRHVILNQDNRGFAAANNQGLAAATGDYLVMLNNDTYVTPGWIATLVGHLRRTATLGMLGPVTNNIGNEARIDIHYANMDEMLHIAADYTVRHAGQLMPLRTAAFFCVMMPREVYVKVGELDEAFGIGFFEDDDYCRRVEDAGWTIACAEDVFIHHNLSASFNKLKQETRQELFEQNKIIYEKKWGKWVPHVYRPKP